MVAPEAISGSKSEDPITKIRNGFELVEDFITFDPASTYIGKYFRKVVSGTGAQVSDGNASNDEQFGLINLETGTTSTGFCQIITSDVNEIELGAFTIAKLEMSMDIDNLSTPTERYVIVMGFHDASGGVPVDGVYFEYSESSSPNWKLVAKNNSVATTVTSSIAADATTGINHIFTIIVTNGIKADFYIDGVLAGTITTNIPATRDTTISAYIVKTVGTTNRFMTFDYIAGYGRWANQRH